MVHRVLLGVLDTQHWRQEGREKLKNTRYVNICTAEGVSMLRQGG